MSNASARAAAGRMALAAAVLGLGAPAHAEPFDGRWVLLQSTTTRADVPVFGPIHATTVAVSLHDVVTRGSRLYGPGTLCALDLESDTSLAQTTIPPALRRILPSPTVDAVLTAEGDRTSFFQASPTVVLGARLNRVDDPLPSDVEDPRVTDDDRDGRPGVTVRVDGIASGELRVVQRTWARLDGYLLRDETFGGIIRHGVTQSILEATSPLLEIGPTVVPVAARSHFRFGRVAPTAKCPDAITTSRAWR